MLERFPDPIDVANDYVERMIVASINAVTNRSVMEPLIVDGQALCIDCESPISERRLAAYPDAVRCIECQTLTEGL